MKKINLLLMLFFITIFPQTVNAYELKCDDKTHNFEDYFYCDVIGDSKKNYDVLSGTITGNENVSCLFATAGNGLKNTSTDNKSFKLTGYAEDNVLAKYKCQIISKLAVPAESQVFINDFKYHELGSTSNDESMVLRSNYIKINKYSVTTTTKKDDKPRDTSNGNSLLKVLIDENVDFTFSRFKTEYNIEVLYEVDKLNLKYAPANQDAVVKVVGDMNLRVGGNVIDIYVTSPDNQSTTCYTLNIKRLARGEQIYYPESDATLASLTITGHALNFESQIFEYKLHLTSDIDAIEINAVPTYEDAVIDISKTTELVDGSLVTITVTSKDGSTTEKYKIRIQKDAPKADYTMYIILGLVVIAVLVMIVVFIKTSQKRKADPLLSLKNDKRKINKGTKFDLSDVPVAENDIEKPTKTADNINVLEINSNNIATPIVAPNMVDNNLNKVTTNQATLDLNGTQVAQQEEIKNVRNQEDDFLELDD